MEKTIYVLCNNLFEIVEDVGGPEEISINKLEIIPLESGAVLPAPVLLPRLKDFDFWYEVTYPNIRDQAKKMRANLGLKHAQCIMKARQEIFKKWNRGFLLFPGTTLRRVEGGELFFPALHGSDGEFLLMTFPLNKKEWDLQIYRFVRWRS